MRSLETAFDVRAGGVLRSIPRHPLTAATLCATTLGIASGAAAQLRRRHRTTPRPAATATPRRSTSPAFVR
ncbi:MAG: hypothetical protein WDN69_08015 [Aliidongia sp.]